MAVMRMSPVRRGSAGESLSLAVAGLEEVPLTEICQPVDVFAPPPSAKAAAGATAPSAVEVDVVAGRLPRLGRLVGLGGHQLDLADPEGGCAELAGQRRDGVRLGLAVQRDDGNPRASGLGGRVS